MIILWNEKRVNVWEESKFVFIFKSQILFFIVFEISIWDEFNSNVHFPSHNVSLYCLDVIFAFVVNAALIVCKFLVVPVFMNEFIEEDLITEYQVLKYLSDP